MSVDFLFCTCMLVYIDHVEDGFLLVHWVVGDDLLFIQEEVGDDLLF